MAPDPIRRRTFLQAGAALGLAAAIPGRPVVARPLDAGAVTFRPEIEPVVRWIEETSRDRILERTVAELNGGLSYRDLLSGLFLAGIRNIKPRPVGFKFHAVLVVHSGHVLGQTAAVGDGLLPIFWALDNFKASQAQDVKEGDWTLAAAPKDVPGPERAARDFDAAMDRWDSEAADQAVAGLVRGGSSAGVFEAIWKYAVRDQRNIGHKPIFAMQCARTLNEIGWEHAEPVLRSLVYGMLDLQGDRNAAPVGPYESNLALAKTLRPDWTVGRNDPGAARALLETFRQATPEGAAEAAAKAIHEGVSPGSVWDAVLLAGNEFLLSEPGIAPLHAVTAANALHYIYETSARDETRRMALLQAAGWLPLYRGRVKDPSAIRLDAIEGVRPGGTPADAAAAIFDEVGRDRKRAAAMAVGYLENGGHVDDVFAVARRMIFHKGTDSHHYKYGAALWEEVRLATDPAWRRALTAAAMSYVPAASAPDSPLMKRAREAADAVKPA
jgi:hypothetical protein